MNLKNRSRDWTLIDYLKLLPAIIIAIIIFYFSSLSNPLPAGPPGPPSLVDVNVFLHACEFATLSFFVAHGYFSKFNNIAVSVITIIFALTDEIHQYFVPNRYFDLFDVLIDIIGVFIGFLVFFSIKALKERLVNYEKDSSIKK